MGLEQDFRFDEWSVFHFPLNYQFKHLLTKNLIFRQKNISIGFCWISASGKCQTMCLLLTFNSNMHCNRETTTTTEQNLKWLHSHCAGLPEQKSFARTFVNVRGSIQDIMIQAEMGRCQVMTELWVRLTLCHRIVQKLQLRSCSDPKRHHYLSTTEFTLWKIIGLGYSLAGEHHSQNSAPDINQLGWHQPKSLRSVCIILLK